MLCQSGLSREIKPLRSHIHMYVRVYVCISRDLSPWFLHSRGLASLKPIEQAGNAGSS